MNLACQTYWAWTIQRGFQHHYWALILNNICYKYWVCTLEYVSCHYWDWSLEVKYCNYWASILVHTFCRYWTYALKQVCCNHWDSTVEHTCHHSHDKVMEHMTCNHWPCSLTRPAASISIALCIIYTCPTEIAFQGKSASVIEPAGILQVTSLLLYTYIWSLFNLHSRSGVSKELQNCHSEA